MIKNNLISLLKNYFRNWAKETPIEITRLANSGSNRKYFRMKGAGKTAIGVFSPDDNENKAFITFTKHFLKKGLNVQKLYAQNLKEKVYLLEDLGDTALFSLVQKDNIPVDQIRNRKSTIINFKIVDYYKRALQHLIRFQIDGNKGLDYSVCYPRKKFDRQSILWDLNYFKYYFLKLAKIPFDEQKLEEDFYSFTSLLLHADSNYFLYRDFQSRNILLKNDDLYFIDYQGGRKGALQYDVASLLFQAQVNLSPALREELLEFYLAALSQKSAAEGESRQRRKVKSQNFLKFYYDYVLIRLLQTFGAYGFRGFYENKTYFLKSIPFALKNLLWLFDKNLIPSKLKQLKQVLSLIVQNEELKRFELKDQKKLKVTINSFSYKKGIPVDYSGNGGGFVFDCRSLNNPGRYPEYSGLTGKDESVIKFLEAKSNVNDFLNSVYSLINDAVKDYEERNFTNLLVNFGCTGGQHRSVYCAEKLADHLKNKLGIEVEINHTGLESDDILPG